VALASPHLRLVGVHAHAGSQIFDPRPAAEVTRALVRFAAHLRATCGADVTEISPGGGWGVAYHPAERTPPIERYAEAVTRTLREEVARARLPEPRLIIEPGRGIVARAGVALYRAGPRKCVPGGRTFVAVDGGMGDNVRPALYGARYHAALPARVSALAEETVCVVGRYCESGDVLVEAVDLPRVAPGEVLAVPVAGAYHLPMASNYNMVPRPAVVFVEDGRAWLVRRRETLADLMACEADDTPKERRTDRSR
jgi:diaminopimelate decarboxylase